MKKSILAFISVIGLIIFVPSFVDWNAYTPYILSQIKEKTNLDVEINGPVRLHLLPIPYVSIEKCVVKNPQHFQSPHLFVVPKISLTVSFLPLMQGIVNFKSLELTSPTLSLETSLEGDNNWQSISKPNDKTSSNVEKSSKKTVSSVVFQHITLTDGTINYVNTLTHEKHTLTKVNLEGAVSSLHGPFTFKVECDHANHKIFGDIIVGKTSQTNTPIYANISLKKNMHSFGSVMFKGSIQNKKIIGSFSCEPLFFPFEFSLPNKKINLKEGFFVSGDIEMQHEEIKLNKIIMTQGSLKATGTFKYTPAIMTLKMAFEQDTSHLLLAIDALSLKSSGWKGNIHIKAKKPLIFTKWISSVDLSHLLSDIFDASTEFQTSLGSYAFSNIMVKSDKLALTGKINLNVESKIPTLHGDITLETLHTAPFFVTPSKDSTLALHTFSQKRETIERWSKTPWDISFAKKINAQIHADIRHLHMGPYKVSNVSTDISIKNGSIHFKNIRAQGYQGDIRGDILMGSKGVVKIALKDMELGDFPSISQMILKKGKATLVTQVTFDAHSLFGAIHSLEGLISFNVNNGIIETIDVKKMIDSIKGFKTIDDISTLTQSLHTKRLTPFHACKATFALNQGKATSQDILLTSEDVILKAKGVCDLPQWTMNMNGTITLKALKNLPPLNITVRGPLEDLTCELDKGQLSKFLIQHVLERVSKNMNGKVGDVLRSVLGGKKVHNNESKESQTTSAITPNVILKSLFG